jgi:hypothetical protein
VEGEKGVVRTGQKKCKRVVKEPGFSPRRQRHGSFAGRGWLDLPGLAWTRLDWVGRSLPVAKGRIEKYLSESFRNMQEPSGGCNFKCRDKKLLGFSRIYSDWVGCMIEIFVFESL